MKRGLLIFLVAWVAGCASGPPPQTLRWHEQVAGNLPASHIQPVIIPSTGQQLVVDPSPTLTERDVFSATLERTPAGVVIGVKFDAHGANLLLEMTTRLHAQSVVIFVNHRPVATQLVTAMNATGQWQFSGDLTDVQAQALVDSLNKTANRRRDIGDTKLAP